MDAIYQSIIDEYNAKLRDLQQEQPELLEMYLCYTKLKGFSLDEKERAIQLKKAKELLDIPEHKQRLGLFGQKINEDFLTEKLRTKSEYIQILEISFQQELKRVAAKNGLKANHVTSVAPKDLLGDKLETSKGALTQFEGKRGDFLFATTLPNGKGIYAVRETGMRGGMIRIDDNTYLFLSEDNIKISDKIKLKKPKYVYELDVENFTPETAFVCDREGNYKFLFDDEWWCSEPQKVLDENRQPLVNVVEISDVTALAHDYQLYVANDARKALDALNEKNFNYSFGRVEALKFCLKAGYVKNINGQMVQNLIANAAKAESEQQKSILEYEGTNADNNTQKGKKSQQSTVRTM